VPRDIFVSYSLPDRNCALELVARVEACGIECWIAPRDISPSADWAAEIIDAISAARVMVLVFSANSNESPQVRREVERAVHKRLMVVPFRIDDVMPSKSLEYFLSSQHWLDAFPPPLEPHYQRLCAHLRRTLHGNPTRTPAGAAGPATSPPSSGHHRFEPSVLRHIEMQLAIVIGPVARVLVQRAASQASSIDDLTQRLGAELEPTHDRGRFLDACRQPAIS
jgi:hypothetical protein